MKNILVTGGAGYVGSHVIVSLLEQGYGAVSADNFANASPKVYQRLRDLTGKDFATADVDVCDAEAMARIMREHDIWAVIHCAGYKAVPESSKKPLEYYQNNLGTTLALCKAMRETGVTRFVFSSSATVYGTLQFMPITEEHPVGRCANPYGTSKAMCEQILTDTAAAYPGWGVILLRYFNPIGAHPSGRIGDSPGGVPFNIMPIILQQLTGKIPAVPVTGDDYDTPDGTGIRDYLHITDLAEGHVAALGYLEHFTGTDAINLGTGQGLSVQEILRGMEQAAGRPIPVEVRPRRPGDIAEMQADPSKAKRLLGWETKRTLEEMCADAWRWASQNPSGYEGE
ncbi:MAG: UDP-glucose 4-epimerase GalE [Oscillospiraceae bacterium]|jgi:UDP-glucose 4-epimerase|nr:UDP-glucose 4-epimerase GalE [Oscillospiraceae bacterium]